MVLSDCQIMETNCIFLLIDNGVIPFDVVKPFMGCMFYRNFEMYVLLDWMLERWVLLREHRFHLPKKQELQDDFKSYQ